MSIAFATLSPIRQQEMDKPASGIGLFGYQLAWWVCVSFMRVPG